VSLSKILISDFRIVLTSVVYFTFCYNWKCKCTYYMSLHYNKYDTDILVSIMT
jgi:hypothetical protein